MVRGMTLESQPFLAARGAFSVEAGRTTAGAFALQEVGANRREGGCRLWSGFCLGLKLRAHRLNPPYTACAT